MKKRLIFCGLSLLLAISLIACGAPTEQEEAKPAEQEAEQEEAKPAEQEEEQEEAAEQEVQEPDEKTFNLKLAGIKTDDDPASVAMELFAEEVNKNSGGTITVKTYTNSALGGLTDLLSGMQNDTIDMMYNTFSCYTFLDDGKKFTALFCPYLWVSIDEFQAFLESDTAQGWLEEAATASGVRTLIAKGELPPRQLTANRAITNAADIDGLKIRTAESPLVQEIWKKLGAVPVVIPFADLYMGLKTGLAEAQENNFVTAQSSSLYEVQTHFMKTDYSRDVSSIFISENVWQEMSDSQKQVMLDAADKAVMREEELVAEKLQETVDFLKTEMTYVEPDLASIQEMLGTDIYEDFDAAGDLWPTGTMDEILNFKATYTE